MKSWYSAIIWKADFYRFHFNLTWYSYTILIDSKNVRLVTAMLVPFPCVARLMLFLVELQCAITNHVCFVYIKPLQSSLCVVVFKWCNTLACRSGTNTCMRMGTFATTITMQWGHLPPPSPCSGDICHHHPHAVQTNKQNKTQRQRLFTCLFHRLVMLQTVPTFSQHFFSSCL